MAFKINKTSNEYADVLPPKFYESMPKAVFAAVAVSVTTCGGDYLDRAQELVLAEWWALYDASIVPQKPPFPRPIAAKDGDDE